MLEILESKSENVPKIIIIGVGGAGNNAIDRMTDEKVAGVDFAAVNTDEQVLNGCLAEFKIQIGAKLTNGFGAGADPAIGEAAAAESEEEIKKIIQNYNMAIITCGMGGGTGTGAAPVVAGYCKEMGILTVGVITTPFSFESIPRITAAKAGVENMEKNVDTLLVIPNDKLIGLSDKPLMLDDAFSIADSVLKYTIEGITNIIYNKGVINLDFNDLKTTLINKGKGHLGIGTVSADEPIINAVKQAVDSQLLDTSIAGAANLLINTCGRIDINGLNEAISYVREIAGANVNIIWGTVTGADYDEGKNVVTIIATGMSEEKRELPKEKKPDIKPLSDSEINAHLQVKAPKEIVMPTFLMNRKR
jgi:cell division protein FtsZ